MAFGGGIRVLWTLFLVFPIYLYRKLKKSSCLKPLDRFQYNFAEMFLWWASTKIVQANWICQKTWLPGGGAYFPYTVDSRYLDPSYLDPITYVELISKSRLFSLCIYCISASRMSNYFYVYTSAISSIIFSPWIYFSQVLLPRISSDDEEKKNVRCGAAGLSVNENHNRPLINKSIF